MTKLIAAGLVFFGLFLAGTAGADPELTPGCGGIFQLSSSRPSVGPDDVLYLQIEEESPNEPRLKSGDRLVLRKHNLSQYDINKIDSSGQETNLYRNVNDLEILFDISHRLFVRANFVTPSVQLRKTKLTVSVGDKKSSALLERANLSLIGQRVRIQVGSEQVANGVYIVAITDIFNGHDKGQQLNVLVQDEAGKISRIIANQGDQVLVVPMPIQGRDSQGAVAYTMDYRVPLESVPKNRDLSIPGALNYVGSFPLYEWAKYSDEIRFRMIVPHLRKKGFSFGDRLGIWGGDRSNIYGSGENQFISDRFYSYYVYKINSESEVEFRGRYDDDVQYLNPLRGLAQEIALENDPSWVPHVIELSNLNSPVGPFFMSSRRSEYGPILYSRYGGNRFTIETESKSIPDAAILFIESYSQGRFVIAYLEPGSDLRDLRRVFAKKATLTPVP